MSEQKLTGQNFWEDYWEENKDTGKPRRTSLLIREILSTFDRHLPAEPGLSILEVGGAMGEYLLYLTRRFGYTPHSLDYSRAGNLQTLDTFARAGRTVEVYERDLFADNSDLPLFDIVFSLGFIEHFDDPASVIEKHLALLKPGGILLLGVPNYAGIYRPFLHRMAPSIEQTHNLAIMDLRTWKRFEDRLRLAPLFTGYVGGFEPLNMKKMEVRTPLNHVLYFFTRVLMVFFSFRFRFLRRFNSRHWSGYLVGIYRKRSA